jgi:hypothetical protein
VTATSCRRQHQVAAYPQRRRCPLPLTRTASTHLRQHVVEPECVADLRAAAGRMEEHDGTADLLQPMAPYCRPAPGCTLLHPAPLEREHKPTGTDTSRPPRTSFLDATGFISIRDSHRTRLQIEEKRSITRNPGATNGLLSHALCSSAASWRLTGDGQPSGCSRAQSWAQSPHRAAGGHWRPDLACRQICRQLAQTRTMRKEEMSRESELFRSVRGASEGSRTPNLRFTKSRPRVQRHPVTSRQASIRERSIRFVQRRPTLSDQYVVSFVVSFCN